MSKLSPGKVVSDLRRLKAGKEVRFPTVTLLGDGSPARVKHVLPTGLTVLDRWVLGIGGLAYGRLIEIFGQESAGKDTVMNHILAGAQRDGSIAALADTEHKWDPDWGKLHGVNTEDLIWDQPGCLEDSMGLIEELVKRSTPERRVVIALNSVAASPPRSEVTDGVTGEAAMGETARLWSHFCRGIVGLLDKHQALLVLINQIRMKIGVMYGNPEVTPGGNAIKFYAQTRLSVNHGKYEDGKRARAMKVTAVKNSGCPPMRSAVLRLHFTEGMDDYWSVLNHGKEMGVIGPKVRSLKAAMSALGWPMPEGKNDVVSEEVPFDPETGEVLDVGHSGAMTAQEVTDEEASRDPT